MNKTELVESISVKTGISKKKIELVLNTLLAKIKESVHSGETVEIRGFGSFSQVKQEKRQIKSPIAGKTIDVPAKIKLNFKPSKSTEKEI